MATGTGAGLLEGPRPQSVYKHGVLDQYAIRYATMTASRLTPKRAVLFDGYSGRGRFDTGEAASAEYMMLAAQKVRNETSIDIFLVEQNRVDFERLEAVADEYRARGIRIETRHGDCADHLNEAAAWAADASLFLFLDPCGATLPFETLPPLLARRGRWPRTEVLLNFNADLIRRAGGQYKKGQLDLGGVAAADLVCGGDWWREVALRAHLDAGGAEWGIAAEAVAEEYARQLTQGSPYSWVVAPVRRQVHHQPVYFLIFLTADPHGLWVFGVAAAKAREKWLKALGPDSDALEEMLFDTVESQIEREHERATGHIKANLQALVADGASHPVVESTNVIFGEVYGEAKETAFTAALRELVKTNEIAFIKRGSKPHQHVITRG